MKTKGTVAIFMLVLPLFCGSSICDADGFDSVRCGSDVRKALLRSTRKIDDKQMKFVKLQTEGLRCSRDGIITADGGL